MSPSRALAQPGAEVSTPLYRLIQEELRRAIAKGKYPAGSQLPSERELTERFGVSSITVRRALDDLAAAGVIERGRGRRARVRQPRASAELEGSLQGLFETILVQGWNNEVTILEFGRADAPDDVAAAMGVEPGTLLHCTVSLMRRHGKLICHARHWVPENIGARIQKQELVEVPRLLLMMRLNIRMERADQSIASCPAPPEMTEPFDIAGDSPMLRIVRTTFDEKDQGVEHVVAHFPWDRFEYRMTMRQP